MITLELVRPALVLLAPAALMAALVVRVRRLVWARAWRRVAQAERLVLAQDPFGPPAAALLTGQVARRACRVVVQDPPGRRVTAEIELRTAIALPFTLNLTRQAPPTWLERRLSDGDVDPPRAEGFVLGDPAFDQRYLVRTSDVTRARRVLSAAARSRLLAADLERVQVGPGGVSGELRAQLPGPGDLTRRLSLALPALADLAAGLEVSPRRRPLVPPLAAARSPSSHTAEALAWLVPALLLAALAMLALATDALTDAERIAPLFR